jgi:S-adenosylmethionine/arginine decarboxylase-like enzyme
MPDTGLEERGTAFQVQTGVFGMHLVLDGYGGDFVRLADPDVIRAWLDELPRTLGMSKLIEPCLVEVGPRGEKDPGGVTGFVLIAESHLSIHTFPQRRFLTADIFTCKGELDEHRVRDSLIASFGLEEVDSDVIRRGRRYPLTDLVGPAAARSGAALNHRAPQYQLAEVPAVGYALDQNRRAAKARFLQRRVEHIDISRHDTRALIAAFAGMSFSARDLARATDIYARMLGDPDCTIILALAGSTSAAGCLRLYADLVDQGMVDVVVATGASVVDMDLFEAIGFTHYQGSAAVNDQVLRQHRIDRIYDTYIDEEQLQACDRKVKEIADALPPGAYSSRAFIREMGRWLVDRPERALGRRSLVQACF